MTSQKFAPIMDLEQRWLANELALSFLEISSYLLLFLQEGKWGWISFVYFHIWGNGEINLKGVSSLI